MSGDDLAKMDDPEFLAERLAVFRDDVATA
jgi:hypothetical protein